MPIKVFPSYAFLFCIKGHESGIRMESPMAFCRERHILQRGEMGSPYKQGSQINFDDQRYL